MQLSRYAGRFLMQRELGAGLHIGACVAILLFCTRACRPACGVDRYNYLCVRARTSIARGVACARI